METLFGRLAVHHGFISMEQLAEATRMQSRSGSNRRIGQVLVELGFIDLNQLNQLLIQQKAYLEERAKRASNHVAQPIARIAVKPPPVTIAEIRPTKARTNHDKGRRPSLKLRKRGPSARIAASLARAMASNRPVMAAKTPSVPPPPATPVHSVGSAVLPTELSVRLSGRDDPGTRRPMNRLRTCISEAFTLGASDVHAHAVTPMRIRLHGRLSSYGNHIFDPIELELELRSMMPPAALARFDETGQADFIHLMEGVGRCRINVYRQLHGVDAVMRLLAATPPTLGELGMPSNVARVTNFDHGLVIVSGRAGSGRTSTLAGLVDLINEERRAHVVTIEDPIEYVHTHKRSVINQRQVGEHTASFKRALQAATREGADVIVLSALPDAETVELALTAAETGHLVISTLPTGSLEDTIQRLQNSLTSLNPARARNLVADTLRAVVTQCLVPAAHRERQVVATGLLQLSPAFEGLIRDDKVHQLANLMQTHRAAGNWTLDDGLARLMKVGHITRESARLHANDPTRFEATRQPIAQGG